ncbi:hypothetical protein HCN44_001887 [Aphidius gifuensis]|uniref:Odorant receptor n=1 Tax=Aphidius gifuensis TaxID=684658 RepID=A0A834XZ42_APHGI|nr:hypothetical protein HCN44_001887 [Aphidius gifuensis]
MTEFIALTFSLNDPNEFAKATFLLLPNIVSVAKYLNIIIERKNIKKLMSYSKRDQFKPRNSIELKILENFKNQITMLFWTFGILKSYIQDKTIVDFFTDSVKFALSKIIMVINSINIASLRILGLWYSDDNAEKSKIYILYTLFLISIGALLIITEFIALIFSLSDSKEFANASFMFLANLISCTKILNMIIERKSIKNLMLFSKRDQFKPRDSVELKILENFKHQIKILYCTFGLLGNTSAILFTTASCFDDIPEKLYPYKAWLPVFLTKNYYYFITFFYQHLTTAYYANVNVAFDSFIAALMMETQAHLRILKYRFSKINDNYKENINITSTIEEKIQIEKKYLIDCFKYYFNIHEFAKSLNGTFTYSIFIQYFVNSIAICSSAFQLTYTDTLSKEFGSLIVYIICMTLQIYLYCSFGENISYESETLTLSIYDSEWTSLSINERKSLIIIMASTLAPQVYKSGYMITLSLRAFTNVSIIVNIHIYF